MSSESQSHDHANHIVQRPSTDVLLYLDHPDLLQYPRHSIFLSPVHQSYDEYIPVFPEVLRFLLWQKMDILVGLACHAHSGFAASETVASDDSSPTKEDNTAHPADLLGSCLAIKWVVS